MVKNVKKFFVCCLALLFIVPCVVVLSACGGSKKPNLANCMVKNFADYTSLGAAHVGSGVGTASVSPASTGVSPQSASRQIKLVGRKLNGALEEILFTKNGKDTIKQSWRLRNMAVVGKFVFVTYSNINDDHFDYFDLENHTALFMATPKDVNYVSYVMDTTTGKIYSYNQIWKNNIIFDSDDMVYNEREEALYYSTACVKNICRISVENNNLALEKLIDCEDFFDTSKVGNTTFQVDTYGNLFFSNSFYKSKYIRTNAGQLKVVDDHCTDFKQSVNKEVYCTYNVYNDGDTTQVVDCQNKKFDQNGELVDVPADEAFLDAKENRLVTVDGNTKYYLNSEANTKTLTATVWDDNNHFTMTTNPLSRAFTAYACTGNQIYFLQTQAIFTYDLTSHEYQDLVSDYVFNSIAVGDDHQVWFTGVDRNLNKVRGVIKADGTITVDVSANNYEIIYIKPLN